MSHLPRQVAQTPAAAVADCKRRADDIAQFVNISRPVVFQQALKRVRFDGHRPAIAGLGAEQFSYELLLVGAVDQSRQLEGYAVEPVIKILPELAARDHGTQ